MSGHICIRECGVCRVHHHPPCPPPHPDLSEDVRLANAASPPPDVMERARAVAKAIEDPWGAPVANDVREILVEAIAKALTAEREQALEEAASYVDRTVTDYYVVKGIRALARSSEQRTGKLWAFIEKHARQDPAFYAAWKNGQRTGGKERAVLALLEFLKQQRDSLYARAVECSMKHPSPIFWVQPDLPKSQD